MSAFDSMKLRTKLLAGFLLVSLITLVVGVFGVVKLHQVDDADTLLYTGMTVPLAEIGDISSSFLRIRINLRDYATTKDKAEREKNKAKILELRTHIAELFGSFEKSILTDAGKKDFAELTAARKAYVDVQEKVFALASAGKDEEAHALISGEGRVQAQKYQEQIAKLTAAKVTLAKQTSDGNTALAKSSANLMYALIALGLLCSVGLGVLLTKNVMAQLGEDPGYLAEVAGKIAGGDLNVAFRPQKKEGGVYHVLQGMVATMKGKIAEADQKSTEAAEQARQAQLATDEANAAKAAAERAKAEGMMQAARQLEKVVEVVSSASEQLSAQIEQSSRGTDIQSTRVAETATAMEEMNSTVLEVARNASQAAESTDTARKKATEGSQVVSKVVDGIGEMHKVSVELKADMAELGKQAESIGQIMNVISDIADQTNLLALNAAIEAARAGDAGRGFAVVADEVRKLAEKTMTATKEVGEAIRGIQDGTRKNLENVDRSSRVVETATGLAQQSGEALNEIVHVVETATDQVRSIATASEQQSATSEEINRSIEEINRISSETSDAMRQSSQAVGELASQAQNLRALIESMKTGG